MSKNFELLQQIAKEQDLFRTPDNTSVAIKTADHEPAPAIEIEHQEPAPIKPTVQSPRPELGKAKVRSWIRETQSRWAPRATELGKVTRREEMKLAQRIFPMGGQHAPQMVIFSGVETGSAAAAICARTSEILAARGEGPACIIDANLEAPLLHRYFRLANVRGLSEAICTSGPVQEFVHNISTNNLWVMPAGVATLELSAPGFSERLNSTVTELRTLFKYVVVHSPLYLDRASSPLTFAADGLVLVIEANSTRRETVREVMQELQVLGTRVLGVVLNNRTFPIPEALYHKL